MGGGEARGAGGGADQDKTNNKGGKTKDTPVDDGSPDPEPPDPPPDDGRLTSYTSGGDAASRYNVQVDLLGTNWTTALQEDIVLHEMTHTLGFGTLWDNMGLLTDDGGDLRFTGPLATAAYHDAFADVAAADDLAVAACRARPMAACARPAVTGTRPSSPTS